MSSRTNKTILNNKGFSLVELIVVVLIMGTIAGGAALSLNTVINADTKRAAQNFMAVMVEARQRAMAQEEVSAVSVKLYMEDDNLYASIYHDADLISTQKLGNYKIDLKVGPMRCVENSLPMKTVTGNTDATSVTYTFVKATGAISGTGQEDVYFYGSTTYHVIVVDLTGRCYLDE